MDEYKIWQLQPERWRYASALAMIPGQTNNKHNHYNVVDVVNLEEDGEEDDVNNGETQSK